MAKKVVAPIWSEDGQTLTNALVNDRLKTYNVVTEWYDGTPMNSTKVDDDLVYISYEGKFLKENFIKEQDTFLEKDTVQQIRNLSTKETLLLKMGVYKGVTLNGYYKANDTPKPIQYYLSSTTEVDDGGSVFEVDGIKLEHEFKGAVDVRYFGANVSLSNNFQFLENCRNYCSPRNIEMIFSDLFKTTPFVISTPIVLRGTSLNAGIKLSEDTSNSDSTLSLEDSSIIVFDLTVDSNSSVVTPTGRGEGIRILGDVTLYRVKSINTKTSNTANGFEINGNAELHDCIGDNVGYASFAVKSGNAKFFNCKALNWEEKGFICNANADYYELHNCYSYTNKPVVTGDDSGTAFLVDTGATNKIKRVSMIGCISEGNTHVVDCKIVTKGTDNFCDNIIIDNCKFLGIGTTYSLWTTGYNTSISRTELAGIFTDAGNPNQKVSMTDIIQKGGRSDFRARQVFLKNFYIENPNNSNGGIRTYGNATYGQDIVIDNIILNAATNPSTDIIWVSTSDIPNVKSLKVSSYFIISGRRLSTSTDLMTRIERLPNTAVSNTIPTTGNNTRGSIVWKEFPSVGDPVGWICTVSGTPGTWLPFGVVGIGNATTTTKGLVNQGVAVPDGSSIDTLLASLRAAGLIATT